MDQWTNGPNGLVLREYSKPPLKLVHFVWLGYLGQWDRKCPYPFDQIAAPSTTLLSPACKNNYFTKRAVAQLDRVCATRMYCYTGHVKFQTGIFAEWKAHLNTGLPRTIRAGLGGRLH